MVNTPHARVALPPAAIMSEIHDLWDEMADFGAKDVDHALLHFMRRLAGLVEAQHVNWIGAVRVMAGRDCQPGLNGWRAVAVRALNSSPEYMEMSKRAKTDLEKEPSPTTLALVKGSGRFRTHLLHEKGFIDQKALRKSEHYRVALEAFDVRDRIYCVAPVNPQAESYFMAERIGTDVRFRKEEAAIMSYTLRGIKWFHKELMLAHGLNIAEKPLSTTERRIVRLMLTDKTEQEIADAMRQSRHTTHGYIKEILRRYGVRGRTGLMALWLSRMG